MDLEEGRYIIWLENWLNEFSECQYSEPEGRDDHFTVDFSKYSSLPEVSLEIYNSIKSSGLSLEQLSTYINKLGVIISQTDLGAISTQPRSKMAKMFSIIFETSDVSNILLESINENSYAYVYLMIRVLFEIILYTESTPVRSFAHSQIVKNKHIINALISLSYNPSTIPIHYTEMEEFVVNRKVNPIGEIGYPSSNFRQNIFEILVLEMLNNTDLNLCCTGIQLLSEVPTIASRSPQILNALFLLLIGPDDELSYLSALSLSKILPLLSEQVSLNFVKACYSNAIKSGNNVQRIKNFTLLTLACKQLKNISTYLYRMVWAVIISLDSHTKLSYQAKAILTEQKIALVLSSTLISIESQTNLKRHRERLEGLLHQNLNFLTLNPKSDLPNFENNRINLLFIRGLIYGLFLVYFSSEVDKPLIDKMADLTNITINNTLNPHKYVNIDKLTDGTDPLLNRKEYFFSFIYYGTCVKLLEFFVKTGNSSVFTQFLDCLKESLKYSSGNVNIIFIAKKCLKYLQNPCTILISLFTLIEQHISGLGSVSRIKILLALLEIIEYSFLTNEENFAQFLSKYNETISNKSLKLIMRPLLQIQNVNYESILSEHDILAHHLYSPVNNETLTETFKTRPIVLDFLTGKSYVGDGSLTVVITKPKFSWGSEYSKILKKQIILNFIENEKRVECCDIYSNLYKVGNLCLRLGFYNEASSIFSRISFVSEDNYYWLRILYNFSNTCNINGAKKSEDLSAYFTKYISSVKNVLGLFKLMKTTNILKSQKQATKCWDYNLNYHLPNSVLHTFVTLIVCTKLGIADLITCLKDKNYQVLKYVKLFMSLKVCFKLLEFMFRLKSMETVYIFSCYQGITTIILQVLNSLEMSKSRRMPKDSCRYEEDYFWQYLQEFNSTLEKPDILYILDLFPPKNKRSLFTNIFTSQKLTRKTASNQFKTRENVAEKIMPENSRFKMNYSCEDIQTSLETIWLELVGSMRLTSKDFKIHLFHRDVPTLKNIYKLLQPLSQGYSDLKFIAFLESVIFSEIPTPIGVLKAFPLPFASITATLLVQTRGELELQTVKFRGDLKNSKDLKNITHVSILMIFPNLENRKKFVKSLKLIENTVSTTVLIRVSQETFMKGSLVSVPTDKKMIPRGVPCPVLINQKMA